MRLDRFMLTLLTSLLLILSSLLLPAQNADPSRLYFSLNYRTGQNRPHRDIIRNLDFDCRGVEAKVGWQTPGLTDWQQAYRFPALGIGVNWNTFNNTILGNPAALYAFTAFPQFRFGRFRFDLEANLGISYGLNPYDPVTNPENFAVGSAVNAYFGLFLEQSFRVSPRFELFLAEGFSHYSNATLNYPNLGLNVFLIKTGIKYSLQPVSFEPKRKLVADKDWSLRFCLFSGMKKLTTPTPTYFEQGLTLAVNKRLSYKNLITLGYEAAYNQATQAMYWDRTLTFGQLISQAVYAGHEFLIDRFSIGTFFGIYLAHQPTDKFYYERLSLGYEVFPQTRISLCLKAHYIKAEYLELGISRQIRFGSKRTKPDQSK